MKFSKKGDLGKTSLLSGQRVPKFDPRPQTYGVLDEASSVLGVARAMTTNQTIKDILLSVQKDLLIMGAEIALPVEEKESLPRRINGEDVKRIEGIIQELQKSVKLKNEFVYPGETVVSAQIDVGRTVIRRAERKAAKLKEDGLVDNLEIHKYLNRAADMLFTLSRYEEAKG